MDLSIELKTTLLGMFCAGMEGRDTRPYILKLDGRDCVTAHNVLRGMDTLLKAQWELMGAPTDVVIR